MTGDRYEYLPGVLAEIAEAAGLRAALRLAMAVGGTRLYVPRAPRPHHLIVRVVGMEAAREIAPLYPTETIPIPLGPATDHRQQRGRIRRMLESDLPVQEIARQLRCSTRTIQRVRAGEGGDDQPDLFGAELPR